jgi:hypothetical protein
MELTLQEQRVDHGAEVADQGVTNERDGQAIDLLLVTLAILMVFQGRKAAMISLPVIAILLGFASDRSPATIILALLPLLRSPLPARRVDKKGHGPDVGQRNRHLQASRRGLPLTKTTCLPRDHLPRDHRTFGEPVALAGR